MTKLTPVASHVLLNRSLSAFLAGLLGVINVAVSAVGDNFLTMLLEGC